MPYQNYNKSSKEKFPWLGQVIMLQPDGTKKQRRHQCRTKKEALKWEAEERGRLEAEANQEAMPLIRTVSLHEWSTAYLDYAKARFVEATYQEKRFAFKLFFQHIQKDAQSNADGLECREVLSYLQSVSSDRSGYCANKQRKNMRSAWQWGVMYMDFPRDNPFDSVQRFAEVRNERVVPTMDEFWKVYSVAEGEQDQLLLFMYLHTGARRDELFRLRWKDIDFQGKRILLSSRKNKAGEWEQKWIPAGEDLLSMLRTHQKVTGLLGFVFLNQCDHDPQKWIPYQYRNKWMPQLCKRARVTPFGIHGIRHLTASLLAGANLPLIAIKEMLRHKSINTTQRYIHSLSEGNREVLEALPGIGEIAKNALRTPCKVDGFLKQSASS